VSALIKNLIESTDGGGGARRGAGDNADGEGASGLLVLRLRQDLRRRGADEGSPADALRGGERRGQRKGLPVRLLRREVPDGGVPGDARREPPPRRQRRQDQHADKHGPEAGEAEEVRVQVRALLRVLRLLPAARDPPAPPRGGGRPAGRVREAGGRAGGGRAGGRAGGPRLHHLRRGLRHGRRALRPPRYPQWQRARLHTLRKALLEHQGPPGARVHAFVKCHQEVATGPVALTLLILNSIEDD
jgi:hypothetical protein